MLSKPAAVATPGVAWLLDVLVMRTPVRRATLRMLPWLLLAIPVIVIGRLAQPADFVEHVPLHLRPLVAADAIAFYLMKLVWPLSLGADYGRTPQVAIARGFVWWMWLLPTALLAIAMVLRRRWPALLAGFAILAVALSPVLGLVRFDFQIYSTVADHYAYLALFGPALALAWLVAQPGGVSARILTISLLALLAILSHRQARHWHDGFSIWEHALRVNAQSWVAHREIAEIDLRAGRRDAAMEHAQAALRLNSKPAAVHITLAQVRAALGDPAGAMRAYEAALAREPNRTPARVNYAVLLERAGRVEDAFQQYNLALEHDPRNVGAHVNLAGLLAEAGRMREAIEHYRAALQVEPTNLDALKGLTRLLNSIERTPTTESEPAGARN
jgi:tetratricopeptide (TPR) repeat protein